MQEIRPCRCGIIQLPTLSPRLFLSKIKKKEKREREREKKKEENSFLSKYENVAGVSAIDRARILRNRSINNGPRNAFSFRKSVPLPMNNRQKVSVSSERELRYLWYWRGFLSICSYWIFKPFDSWFFFFLLLELIEAELSTIWMGNKFGNENLLCWYLFCVFAIRTTRDTHEI